MLPVKLGGRDKGCTSKYQTNKNKKYEMTVADSKKIVI